MELTRRDAIRALVVMSGGTGVGSALTAEARRDQATPNAIPESVGGDSVPGSHLGGHEIETMIAIARVVYPTTVSGIDEFVRTFLDRRVAGRPDRASEIARVVTRLDELGREWHGGPFEALDPDVQDRLLREVGADSADADPAGTIAERVRYFLINELLFALYASPTGGVLLGLENPQGYPGGLGSYQRGPLE